MLRLYDWQCECGETREDLVDVRKGKRPPRTATLVCRACRHNTKHRRVVMNIPGKYLRDRPLSPRVGGGRFDTMGMRRPPRLPKMPGEAEFDKRCSDAVREMGPRASSSDVRNRLREMSRDAPTLADYAAHMNTPDYRSAEEAHLKVRAENREKRKRVALLRRGEKIDFRRHKCAGDPNLED